MSINVVRLVLVEVITGLIIMRKDSQYLHFLNAYMLIPISLAVTHYRSSDILEPRHNIVPTLIYLLCYNGFLSIWLLYNQLNPSGNGATVPLEEERYSVKMSPHPCLLQVAVVYKYMYVSKWDVGINYGILHMLCNSYNVSWRL